jgi:hypothetical protein
LPEPPEGMVYQVWALKLDPLTPTSISLLENFDKMIKIAVNNANEAFGITLEPKGGSLTPTMEQLYIRKSINYIFFITKRFNCKVEPFYIL